MPPFKHPRRPLSLPAAACCLLAWAALPAASAGDPAVPAAAGVPPSVPAGLDTGAVHGEYLDGNLENVASVLEKYRKEHPVHSRGDSLFIARHLAVVYSADPGSSESARFWMRRLAVLSPTADLAGMYTSESIERTFAEVKAEVRSGARGRRGRWLWIGAGGTALAAATALVILAAQSGDEEPRRVPVDL